MQVAPASISYSSDTPAVATVDPVKGIVTAVGAGSVNITATKMMLCYVMYFVQAYAPAHSRVTWAVQWVSFFFKAADFDIFLFQGLTACECEYFISGKIIHPLSRPAEPAAKRLDLKRIIGCVEAMRLPRPRRGSGKSRSRREISAPHFFSFSRVDLYLAPYLHYSDVTSISTAVQIPSGLRSFLSKTL